jgi:hypothetical protein
LVSALWVWLLTVLVPGFVSSVRLLSERRWLCCPVCPGAHRLRLRRDCSPFALTGCSVLVKRVRAWRIAAASR